MNLLLSVTVTKVIIAMVLHDVRKL